MPVGSRSRRQPTEVLIRPREPPPRTTSAAPTTTRARIQRANHDRTRPPPAGQRRSRGCTHAQFATRLAERLGPARGRRSGEALCRTRPSVDGAAVVEDPWTLPGPSIQGARAGKQAGRCRGISGLWGAARQSELSVLVAEGLPVVVTLREVGPVVVGSANNVEVPVTVEVDGAHAEGVADRLGAGGVEESPAAQDKHLRDLGVHAAAID